MVEEIRGQVPILSGMVEPGEEDRRGRRLNDVADGTADRALCGRQAGQAVGENAGRSGLSGNMDNVDVAADVGGDEMKGTDEDRR